MDLQVAVTYIQLRGGPVEQARLAWLLSQQFPEPALISQLVSLQRLDGGWEPLWAPGYSSLDATCFRLAQAEALGITSSETAVQRAIRFLDQQQKADGSWEESHSVAHLAPPWTQPGSLQARLYLTANCGFWVAFFSRSEARADQAADFLLSHCTPEGLLPSFLHTTWLACGLWFQLRMSEPARRALDYLSSRVQDMEASNLAWMMTTLLIAGIDPIESALQSAAGRLDSMQTEAGNWPGNGGTDQVLHTTLEAMRVLRWLGR